MFLGGKMHKRILVFLLIFTMMFTAIPFSLCDSKTATITLVDAELISNDHVGNEWFYYATIGGKEVSIGDSIEVNTNKQVTLFAESTEDDKIPDVGSKSLKITPKKYIGKNVTIKVTVTENRGRYSGNSAVIEYTFSVQ